MRRALLLVPLVALLLAFVPAPALGDTPRVLVVGDSWAAYIWEQRTIRKVLNRVGHGDKTERGAVTAISGSTAEEWTASGYLAKITTELALYPTIDVVHLSIGGNDLLGNWNASMTPQQELALMQQVQADTEVVVQHIQAQRPGIQVVLIGYDYPNFDEVAPPFSPSWFLWVFLGSPTPSRMSNALADYETVRRDYALATPDVHYIHNLGLMQWFFGYPLYGAPRFAAPFPGQAPNYAPFPGGSSDHPSPPTAMLDAFHLTVKGYQVLVANTTKEFYDPWFDANP